MWLRAYKQNFYFSYFYLCSFNYWHSNLKSQRIKKFSFFSLCFFIPLLGFFFMLIFSVWSSAEPCLGTFAQKSTPSCLFTAIRILVFVYFFVVIKHCSGSFSLKFEKLTFLTNYSGFIFKVHKCFNSFLN